MRELDFERWRDSGSDFDTWVGTLNVGPPELLLGLKGQRKNESLVVADGRQKVMIATGRDLPRGFKVDVTRYFWMEGLPPS